MTLYRPFDFLLLLLVFIATGLAFYYFKGDVGNSAEIHLGSKRVARFNLQGEESIKHIDTRIGRVRIRVGSGSIQVLSSPCNHKICILQGAVHNTHEHVICLPAQMYISVVNTANADNPFDTIDAISY